VNNLSNSMTTKFYVIIWKPSCVRTKEFHDKISQTAEIYENIKFCYRSHRLNNMKAFLEITCDDNKLLTEFVDVLENELGLEVDAQYIWDIEK
jgi:hypothetical protein